MIANVRRVSTASASAGSWVSIGLFLRHGGPYGPLRRLMARRRRRERSCRPRANGRRATPLQPRRGARNRSHPASDKTASPAGSRAAASPARPAPVQARSQAGSPHFATPHSPKPPRPRAAAGRQRKQASPAPKKPARNIPATPTSPKAHSRSPRPVPASTSPAPAPHSATQSSAPPPPAARARHAETEAISSPPITIPAAIT